MINLLKQYYSRVIQTPLRVVDLGSGDGRIVFALAKNFTRWDIRGVEINWELCESGQKLVKSLPNAHIIRGDLFLEDLTGVDIVCLYALPTIMPSLRHVFEPLTKNALIVTFRYPLEIPGVPVKEVFHENLQGATFNFLFFAYKLEARQ